MLTNFPDLKSNSYCIIWVSLDVLGLRFVAALSYAYMHDCSVHMQVCNTHVVYQHLSHHILAHIHTFTCLL